MNKQVQLVNNIIVFVVGLIVVGLVFLFGYSVIDGFNEDRCDVLRLQFGTNLEQAVDRNKNWGTNRVINLEPPCQVAQVCFVDRRVVDANFTTQEPLLRAFASDIQEPRTRQVINNSVWANQNVPADAQRDYTNVFTVSEEGIVLPVERYSTRPAAIRVVNTSGHASAQCYSLTGSRLELRLQGDGTTARIQEVQ